MKCLISILFYVCAFVLVGCQSDSSSSSTDGTIDTSFQITGWKIQNVSVSHQMLQAQLLADDSILIAGHANNADSLQQRAVIVKLNSSGDFDSQFGNNGKIELYATGAVFSSVVGTSDGGVIVASSDLESGMNSSSLAIMKYTSAGAVDTTFGTSGQVPINATISSSVFTPWKIVEQPNGKYVALLKSSTSLKMIRFDSTGAQDLSFGTSGVADCTFSQSEFSKILVDTQGRILILASTYQLARFTMDGAVDTAFGSGTGSVDQSLGATLTATDMALQSDGKIIVTGTSMARLKSDGSLDSHFGSAGRVAVPSMYSASSTLYFASVTLQSNGKILVTWLHNNPSTSTPLIFRFNEDGSTDTTYGVGGGISKTVGVSSSTGENVDFYGAPNLFTLSTGKLMVVGLTYSTGTETYLLARFH